MTESNTIILHYQLKEGHEISAATLATSVKSVEAIAKEMARLIAPKTKLQIIVSPPEEGTFSIKVIIVLGVMGTISLPLIQHVVKGIGIGIAEEVVGTEEPFRDIGRFIGQQITGLTRTTLETPIDVLEETQHDENEPKINSAKDRAIKAKSDLFRVTTSDSNVTAVGFNPKKTDIPRSEFNKHYLIKKRIRPAQTIQENIMATIKQAVIPRDVKGKWKITIDSVNDKALKSPRTEAVYIEDTDFRSAGHQLTVYGQPNVIMARLETEQIYENGILKQKRKAITKVYSFNGERFSDIDPIPSQDSDSGTEPFKLV